MTLSAMFDTKLKTIIPFSRYLITKYPNRFADPSTKELLSSDPPSTAIELTDEIHRAPADPIIGADAEPDTPVSKDAVAEVKATIRRGRGRRKG